MGLIRSTPKRFAYYVGRRCRSATIKDVAAELKLDWHTVKTLDQQYMEVQLKRAGTPSSRVSNEEYLRLKILTCMLPAL